MLVACVDTVHKDNLGNRLNEQRKGGGGAFCDVHLKVAGHTLPTHSCVLSASSPFFRGLIVGDRPDPPYLTAGVPQELELVVPGMEGGGAEGGVGSGGGMETLGGLLDYIYTGKIEFDEDSVDMIVTLADAFMLEGLSALIKNYKKDSTKGKAAAAAVTVPRRGPGRPSTKQAAATAESNRRTRKTTPRKLVQAKTPRKTSPPSAAAETPARRGRKRGPQPRKTRAASLTSEDGSSSSEEEEEAENESNSSPASSEAESRKSEEFNAPPAKKVRKKYVFRCKLCDFVSANVPAIREHKLLHPGRSYTCLSCGFFAGQAAKLLEHLLEAKHNNETRCSLCDFVGSDSSSLKTHFTKHDPAKPFLCTVCEYKCRTRAHLNAHITTHTSDRPFECHVCHSRFKLKYCWQSHLLTHEKGKVYLCDHCGFRTAYKHHLRMHEKIHTGEMLACPHPGCTFRAYSKQNLNKHVLTHDSDKPKPYICSVCGHKYAQQQSLTQHMKVHDESKMLHCPHCQYGNYRSDKLKKHMRKWHSLDQAVIGLELPVPIS